MGCGTVISVVMVLLATVPAFALDAKCSACAALMRELLMRLEKEVPRNHLDMRHRLDKEGKRYGKLIEYKVSELRMLELLGGLCKELDRYEYHEATEAELEGSWSTVSKPNKSVEQAAQAQQQTKQLVNYCHHYLEEYEDDVVAAIREGAMGVDLEDKICRETSGVCTDAPAASPQDEL